MCVCGCVCGCGCVTLCVLSTFRLALSTYLLSIDLSLFSLFPSPLFLRASFSYYIYFLNSSIYLSIYLSILFIRFIFPLLSSYLLFSIFNFYSSIYISIYCFLH